MDVFMSNKHGGKRKGAGKPAQYSEAMVKVDFMLPKEAIEFFTMLGDGNRSEGARRAWRSLTQRAADERESARKIVSVK
jgi:hypothetical protein